MYTHIIPVIHYEDDAQAMRNASRAFEAGCDGVLLIHMDAQNHLLPTAAMEIKARWPDRLIGINFLGMRPESAMGMNVAAGLDMTWTDDQVTHSDLSPWIRANRLRRLVATNPDHLLFTGVAFKHQRSEPLPGQAACMAVDLGFIPTTSGPATGMAAERGKIADMRAAIGPDAPLAIASGITPENVKCFAAHLSHILVATGVSSSFHEFDVDLLRQMRAACPR